MDSIAIGEKLKRLRIENELTQAELANRTELSKGFISQLENGLNSPSIVTLTDILSCLGSDLSTFFSKEEEEKVVVKYEDTFEQRNDELGYVLDWLVPSSQNRDMQPVRITLQCGGVSEEIYPFDGEEFGYVVKGKISINIGKKKYIAKAGESFYFKVKQIHWLENIGKKEAVVLWVTTPPNF